MRPLAVAILAAAVTACTTVLPAYAHHSTGLFDNRSIVKITGTVVEFHWINPHASIVVEGGPGGAPWGKWTVEMMAPTAMMDEGWRNNSLAIGDNVTVFAHPWRNPVTADDSRRLLYTGILLPHRRTLGHVD
jgi:Family of unknown function (DUF6152)